MVARMSSVSDVSPVSPVDLARRWARVVRAVALVRSWQLDAILGAAYFAIGFAPIAALAISLMGFLPLSVSAPALVGPAAALGLVLGLRFPRYGALALKGFAIGVAAVTIYDAMRVPLILLGLWGDFIPNIGKWLLDSPNPNALVGYIYRYMGDGGGMG